MILLHIRKDRYTLSACSLVCQTWRYIGQSLIFRDFHVTIGLKHSFPDFQNFIATTPDISKHIQKFHLHLSQQLQVEATYYPIRPRSLVNLFERCASLREVYLGGIFRQFALDTVPQCSRPLRKLVLYDVGSVDALLVVMQLFPLIEEMHLPQMVSIFSITDAGLHNRILPPTLPIPAFVLSHSSAVAFLADIAKQGCLLDNIHSLKLPFAIEPRKTTFPHSVPDRVQLSNLLRHVGRNLRQLELRFAAEPLISDGKYPQLWILIFYNHRNKHSWLFSRNGCIVEEL